MARERIATWPTGRSNRFSVKPAETLSGTRVITADELDTYQMFSFDPGGSARNVDLPAEEGSAGAYVFLANNADAAEIITVRNDAGSTICTPTQAECAVLWCDGVAWHGAVGAQS